MTSDSTEIVFWFWRNSKPVAQKYLNGFYIKTDCKWLMLAMTSDLTGIYDALNVIKNCWHGDIVFAVRIRTGCNKLIYISSPRIRLGFCFGVRGVQNIWFGISHDLRLSRLNVIG